MGLADTSTAWPWLSAAELPAMLDEPVELRHVRVFPTGPRAVPMALDSVEKFQPDLVVFSFGAYPCAVATVSERIRQRFGRRAYDWFRRGETKFDGALGSTASKPRKVNGWIRWLGRHTIGVAPMASFEEVTGIQSEILQGLSRLEHTTVVVYCEPYVTRGASRHSPDANEILDRDRELIHAIARHHHFLIADCRDGFLKVPDPDVMFLSDALHKSVAGHRVQADALYVALREPDSPYAAQMAAAGVRAGAAE